MNPQNKGLSPETLWFGDCHMIYLVKVLFRFLIFFIICAGPFSLPYQWISQCQQMNTFFWKENLPEIICPSLENFPDNFTLPNGTDDGLPREQTRGIRQSFLEKMFQLGFLSTISLESVLSQRKKQVCCFFC